LLFTLSLHDALPICYGFRCCHLKNIWTAPLPPETELSRQMTTSTTSIDIMGLQAAYANLHTDQERDYFMQRYHDVITFLVSMQIDRKSGSAGMPRPISYAVFCLKKKRAKTLTIRKGIIIKC